MMQIQITSEQAHALEGTTKLLVLLGAFLSAVAGIFLSEDSVSDATTERFRSFWLWITLPIIPPVTYFLLSFLFPDDKGDQKTFWVFILAFVILLALFAARLVIFGRDKLAILPADQKSKKVGWILLVAGFELLLFAAVVDAFKFFAGP